MRAPRRVPWASRRELEELYESLFASYGDLAARKRGLSRLNVYVSSPSCPAFLVLLHGLITASLISPPTTADECMSARLALGMAIVRFVNGMVDPLQVGAYARPISHLAATIGIPPMLVAIRHRATHDDLPPLRMLQGAVSTAVDYLHHYAFLPLLASTSNIGLTGVETVRYNVADGLVRRWKRAMKTRVREKVVGEENETGREIRKIKRDLEVVDAEDLAASLCAVEGLIPLARRKRPGPKSTSPPPASLQVWAPLLQHVVTERSEFPTVLAEQISALLLDPSTRVNPSSGAEAEDAAREEESARWCLATWLIWLWTQQGAMDVGKETRSAVSRQIMGGLLTADPVVRRLHKALALLDERLSDTSALDDLLLTGEPEDELKGLDDVPMEGDAAQKLEEMEARLALVEQRKRAAAPVHKEKAQNTATEDELSPGWTRVSDAWKPCPIGLWVTG